MELLFVIVVVIGIGIYLYKKWDKEQREEAMRIALENKKKKEMEAAHKKRCIQIHDSNLPRIYDKYSVSDLQRIFNLLRTMHYSGPDDWDDLEQWIRLPDSYYDAQDELNRILRGAKWKELNGKGNIYYCDHVPERTVYRDMNYVYRLIEKRK